VVPSEKHALAALRAKCQDVGVLRMFDERGRPRLIHATSGNLSFFSRVKDDEKTFAGAIARVTKRIPRVEALDTLARRLGVDYAIVGMKIIVVVRHHCHIEQVAADETFNDALERAARWLQ
jgi:hypothetical protein